MTPLSRNIPWYGNPNGTLGLVMSGGGVRAAYQAGVLKALAEDKNFPSARLGVVCGSSIGAVNSVLLAGCSGKSFKVAVESLVEIWRERSYSNTFSGSMSLSFMKSMAVAIRQTMYPGPHPTDMAIFNPSLLAKRIDRAVAHYADAPGIRPICGVMTTIESKSKRKGLLLTDAPEKISAELTENAPYGISYLPRLSARHAFASAALPWVLPPVEVAVDDDTVKLVDGGIIDNIPVDPAVRLGANHVLVLDVTGRKWWHDYYNKPLDTPENWAVPNDDHKFCLMPSSLQELSPRDRLGGIVKNIIGVSIRSQTKALGPLYPVFRYAKAKAGEIVALEIITYGFLHPDFIYALLEMGKDDARYYFRG